MSSSTSTTPAVNGVGKRIAKNAGLMAGGKGLGVVLALAVLVVAARALTPEQLGALLLTHAYVVVFAELAAFKSWQAIIRYGSAHASKGNLPALQKILRFCIALDITSAAIAVIVAICLYPIIYQLIGLPPEMLLPGMVYCSLIAFNQRSASTGVLRLIDRFDLLAAHTIVMPFFRLTGGLIAWAMGAGFTGFLIVWFIASLISHLSLPMLASRELHRQNMWTGLFDKPLSLKAPETGIWKFVWMANLDATLSLGDSQLAKLLAGAIFGPAFTAVFSVAQEISNILSRGAMLLDRAIYPELAKMVHEGDANKVWPLIVRTGLALLAVGVAISGIVALFGPAMLTNGLGEAYAAAVPLAILFLISASIVAAAVPLYPALYAIGKPEHALLARGCGIVIYLSLFVVFSLTIGRTGPGWAAIIGNLVGLTCVAMLVKRDLTNHVGGDGQADSSSVLTNSISDLSLVPDERSGGPGQPASGNSTS